MIQSAIEIGVAAKLFLNDDRSERTSGENKEGLNYYLLNYTSILLLNLNNGVECRFPIFAMFGSKQFKFERSGSIVQWWTARFIGNLVVGIKHHGDAKIIISRSSELACVWCCHDAKAHCYTKLTLLTFSPLGFRKDKFFDRNSILRWGMAPKV